MRRNSGSRSQKVILPFCSALVRLHPEYWVLLWAPQYKKDQGIMELIQERAIKMSKSLQYLSYEERLRGLWLFRAEKECFWISDGWLCMPEQRVLRRQSQTLFRAAQCQYKWQYVLSGTQEVPYDHQEELLCCMVVRAPYRLPKEAVESPIWWYSKTTWTWAWASCSQCLAWAGVGIDGPRGLFQLQFLSLSLAKKSWYYLSLRKWFLPAYFQDFIYFKTCCF